jgi:hypothetical protein
LNPKLRGLLARVVLIGGIAVVASVTGRSAPHDQTLVVRLNSRQVSRVSGVVTRQGDSEPAAGFSQDFPGDAPSPATVRHTFSAPNDTYIVVITLQDKPDPATATTASAPPASLIGAGAPITNETAAPIATRTGAFPPIPGETSFERRVSLVGGELTLSPE